MMQEPVTPVSSIAKHSSTVTHRTIIGRKKKTRTIKSDYSIYPSYTNLSLPYCVICRQRYWNSFKEQRRQFISEVATQELLQAMALDGVRVHRIFCQYIFSKPNPKEKITMTIAEERRLTKILGN